ncbi:MAG: zinc ribbon domain-containing protein [Deltaproteobacteria bacterium]|nr:zinc ribbon domain-containing protein [Deltaproteobacteria bacterium]MBW1955681.1 zinc ribbon domain-containing protein [Deltaproteobacteria bacterium]MBW2041170.1 zinc ribbon domain-containing protein [Deltaproteobacteria bacterium]MBW2131954.1 zinc ribbon domain-containing protein [Deltaproteobacteria bacterium]
MPVYEYECTQCGQIEEAFQKFSDKPLTRCRHCSGRLRKLISRSTFHLKGTGWYVTDYANRSKNTQGASEKKAKTDSKSTESTASDTGASKKSDA